MPIVPLGVAPISGIELVYVELRACSLEEFPWQENKIDNRAIENAFRCRSEAGLR